MPAGRLLVLTLLLSLPAPARGDWPHLRGQLYDGVSTETGLADSWPADGPPRLWSRDLGQGHSGFVVADGKLYTQRQTLAGHFVLCLDPDTGDTLWETRCDWAWRGAYPGPYATPTCYQGKVYYSTPGGLVGCLDGRTGDELWSISVRVKFRGEGFGFGYAITPTVEDGRVILPAGGPDASLVALDAGDGHTLWATGSDPASYCPALPITFAGRRCVVGYLQNALVIVEAATGKQLHRQPLSAGYDEHSAWPLYREPHLLLTAPFRAPALRLELRSGSDGGLVAKTQWMNREFSNDVVSSVLVRDHIYGFDLRQLQSSLHRPSRGSFKCVEWATGKVAWSADKVGHASVVAADDKLYLLNDTGSLILAAADPTEYRELGRHQLFEDESTWTPPLIWRGRLFARTPAHAVCLWIGRRVEPPVPPLPPPTSPSRPWRLDSAWLLTHERDFPNDAPTAEEMATWFVACVAILAVAAGVVALLRLTTGRQCGGILIWVLVFVLGLLGPNVFSSLFDRCLFTWPVSLYAVFHLTLRTGRWAVQERSRVAGWLARLTIAVFLLVGYGYFELCRIVGMFVAWAFLFGFPASFPLTWLAVRAEANRRPVWAAVWALLAFAVFFWSGHALLWWKASAGM
jgi:outer membrane protein assembly factor BamB